MKPLYKGDLLTVLAVNLPAHVALGWVPVAAERKPFATSVDQSCVLCEWRGEGEPRVPT
jgi:hypothetical protein